MTSPLSWPVRASGQLTGRMAGFASGLALTPLRMMDPLTAPVRTTVRHGIRRSLGEPHSQAERPRGDPFLDPESVARRVHGDLPAMLIGGVSALLLQTLHPLVMAGVAEHSAYREDPIGRLRRTASFLDATTFGTEVQGRRAIETVRLVHAMVTGRAPDGRHYSAGDPDLLTWVHVAETSSFLAAYQRYGPAPLDPASCDEYLTDTAIVAEQLGAEWVPTSRDEVAAYYARIRPSLYAGAQARVARDFLLRGVARRLEDRVAYGIILSAAVELLPPWARSELGLPSLPLVGGLVVTPVARGFCTSLRWAAAP